MVSVLQGLLLAATAPLLVAWIRRVKARLQNRRGPPLLQAYRNLVKLFYKETLVAHTTSWVFRAAPYLVFGATLLVAMIIPVFVIHLPITLVADVIVIVGLLALARFFLVLAGMDAGTAFGGMGSSREMLVSSLAEPALLMAIFTLVLSTHTTNLSLLIGTVMDTGMVLRPSVMFAFLAIILVVVAETGRIPVDNPTTHLELTMIHEAIILEYSGRYLALMEWAGQVKLLIFGVLIVNIFLPWGIATELTLPGVLLGWVVVAVKLMLLSTLLAFAETALAKMRIFKVPYFLNLALLLALLGVLSHVILEVGAT